MLLECNPCLARYSTFGGLNSPLHFASVKGHTEIVSLLLENGADVNSRNYCGQTALMQACRYGHWEVVQTLLLYRCNSLRPGCLCVFRPLSVRDKMLLDPHYELRVTRADYLSGRTALHFAAVNGHVRCIRLVVADFVPSVPYESIATKSNGHRGNVTNGRGRYDQSALSKFVNKAADGGITALHMAALNGYIDCVQLLLDLHANVTAATFHYGTSMDLIGAGSTSLHYAACGGNLKCCQILIARGASRMALNCNGWLPLDVARMWGRHWLELLLAPVSDAAIPLFTPSKYLALPLMSVLNIARECGLQSSTISSDDMDTCAVCLERVCSVAAEGCGHGLCVRCALYLCSASNISSESVGPPGSIPCPLCRHGIISFVKAHGSPGAKEIKLHTSLALCTPCMLHHCDPDCPTFCTPEFKKTRVASVSSDLLCPVRCTPFPSVAMTMCTCSDGPCPPLEPGEEGAEESPPDQPEDGSTEQNKADRERMERTTCSSMFWGRRSCSREHQCNSEINT